MFGRKGLAAETDSPLNRQPNGRAVPVRYDVTPHPLKMMLVIALFGAAALMMFAKLLDPRGLLINHLIELGPSGADIFFSTMIVACLAMVSLACIGLFRSFGERVYVLVDDQAVTGPTFNNGTRLVRIPYSQLQDIKVTRLRDQEFIVIRAYDGRKIKMGQTNFRDAHEWPKFLAELGGRSGLR